MRHTLLAIASMALVSSCICVNRAAVTHISPSAEQSATLTLTVNDTHSVDGDKAAETNAAVSTSSGTATTTDAEKKDEKEDASAASKSGGGSSQVASEATAEDAVPVTEPQPELPKEGAK